MRPTLAFGYAHNKLMTQQIYSRLMAFPELVEGFQALNLITLHTPPLLHDSSLAFLTSARIYAKLHDAFVWSFHA